MLPQISFAEADTHQSTSRILTKKLFISPTSILQEERNTYKRCKTKQATFTPSAQRLPAHPRLLRGSAPSRELRQRRQHFFPLVLHISTLSNPIRVSSSKSASATHSLRHIGPAPEYKRGQCLRLTASPRQPHRAPGPAACARREAGSNEGPSRRRAGRGRPAWAPAPLFAAL